MLLGDLVYLLDSGEYRRCLEHATALLNEGGHDVATQARIQAAICRCRLELTDYFAAVEVGREAVSLAEEAAQSDLLGSALVDYATALASVRRHGEAQAGFEQFLSLLDQFTAARCMEGTVLQRLGGVLYDQGSTADALQRYRQAQAWFERFGDDNSARACARAMIRIHLDQGDPAQALPLLQAGDLMAEARPFDREFHTDHLLDRALFHLMVGNPADAAREAFQALELADNRLVPQCRAQLLLCQAALAMNQPKDALNFAMAARVSAIDGRIYDLEFEASEILFRLLQKRGARLLSELAGDYYQQGVDVFQYISERSVRRMQQSN